jgi:hypothetical protein
MPHHRHQSRPSLTSAKAFQDDHHIFTPPSRIPRPASTRPSPSSTASVARTSSPSRVTSRKRPRPASVSNPPMTRESLASSTQSSPYFVSPPTSASYFNQTPHGVPQWSTASPSRNSRLESPPPLVNSRYDLANGMDTPASLAERVYDSTSMYVDSTLDGRFGRNQLSQFNAATFAAGQQHGDVNHILGTDRNGQGRGSSSGGKTPPPSGFTPVQRAVPGWGSVFFNVAGSVATGLWNFCKTTAFGGFQSGGGQAYNLYGTPTNTNPYRVESWGHESNWEDENEPLTRSWDRLPTPVPGEYPESLSDEEEVRGKKRLHADGGGWIVVEKDQDEKSKVRLRSRALSPLGNKSPQKTTPARASSVASRRLKAPGNTRRISAVSHAGSPNPISHTQPHRRQTIQHVSQMSTRPRTPVLSTTTTTIGAEHKISPPSVEVRKFQKRMRRDEKQSEEKFEVMNERLRELIRQGKEALGSRVEVVDEGREMDVDPVEDAMRW